VGKRYGCLPTLPGYLAGGVTRTTFTEWCHETAVSRDTNGLDHGCVGLSREGFALFFFYIFDSLIFFKEKEKKRKKRKESIYSIECKVIIG